VTRWNDAKTIVLERLGAPGLLTAISSDVWNRKTVTCATAFGPHAELHDYTGRHPNIWTDGSGRATFTIPSNAFGKGQSYLCFSRPGHDRAIGLHERRTTQTFSGAPDLDIAPARAGAPTQLGRIWCAAGRPLRATLRHAAGPPNGASLVLRVIDGAGLALGSHTFDGEGNAWETIPKSSGWHSLEISTTAIDTAASFELDVTYTATPALDI
jgi:alpha-amylase